MLKKGRLYTVKHQPLADETRLLNLAKRGDQEAIQQLFDHYQGMFCYAWQKHHPSDLSLREWLTDMYQVLYRAVLHYDNRQSASFGHYLYRSLENCAKSRHRHRNAKKRIPEDCLVDLTDQLPVANHESTEDVVYCRQIFQKVVSQELSPFEKEVLLASLVLDLDALCQKFGCQPRVIQSALSRCRKKLVIALKA